MLGREEDTLRLSGDAEGQDIVLIINKCVFRRKQLEQDFDAGRV